MQTENLKLFPLPVHFVEDPDWITLRRGNSSYRIDDKETAHSLIEILSQFAQEPASKVEFVAEFAKEDQDYVSRLVDQLIQWRFLVTEPMLSQNYPQENPIDVYHWTQKTTKDKVAMELKKQRISIIGLNIISQHFIRLLKSMGVSNYELVSSSHLDESNITFESEAGEIHDESDWLINLSENSPDILVLCSPFDNQNAIRNWNLVAYRSGIKFLPVQYYGGSGYIGPLMIKDELPCYECFYRRMLSHTTDVAFKTAMDQALESGDPVGGYHPVFMHLLAHYAFFELERIVTQPLNATTVGHVIQVRPEGGYLSNHKILKAPYCSVCGPDKIFPSTSIFKSAFK